MKTTTIPSVAALLGAAAILNAGLLARPGPQQPAHTQAVIGATGPTATTMSTRTTSSAQQPGGQPKPTLVGVPGPHGDRFIFRR